MVQPPHSVIPPRRVPGLQYDLDFPQASEVAEDIQGSVIYYPVVPVPVFISADLQSLYIRAVRDNIFNKEDTPNTEDIDSKVDPSPSRLSTCGETSLVRGMLSGLTTNLHNRRGRRRCGLVKDVHASPPLFHFEFAIALFPMDLRDATRLYRQAPNI